MAKLFMVLIGCSPKGRFIEQHDIFFGIGESMKDLIPPMIAFWPEASGKIHFDAWREITSSNGYNIEVIAATEPASPNDAGLFFINLGGYKPGEFEEFHYKTVIAAETKSEAISQSKKTSFFKHTGFKGANSHIDDKYGIDVDDIYEIRDILGEEIKSKFRLRITRALVPGAEDILHLGYFKINSFD